MKSPYAWDVRRIVSVDGEGNDTDCTISGDLITDTFKTRRHAYTMLAAADDRGFTAHITHDGTQRWGTGSIPFGPDDVAPNFGLPSKPCLDFLLSLVRRDSDIIVSFSFTYDVTKILQDLPLKNLTELAKTNETTWRRYRIGYLPRKYLEVTRDGHTVTVHDAFSFWQRAFVKALWSNAQLFSLDQLRGIDCRTGGRDLDQLARDKYKVTGPHICTIDNPCMLFMKENRKNFEHFPAARVLAYCLTECHHLSVIFRDLLRNVSLPPLELNITKWSLSGPGGFAKALYAKMRLKDYMPLETPHTAAPGLPLNIPLLSYYGGRFEIQAIGFVGDVTGHDLHSAYPAAAVDLPCLRCGHFTRTDHYVPGKLGFYLVGSNTAGPWAPFPFRANATTAHHLNGATPGSIAYAHGGQRWVTSHEVEAARAHFGADAIPVFKGYVYDTSCTHQPFKLIKELYLLRKVGHPQTGEKPSEGLAQVIKLILNSVYGVLAQVIGAQTYTCRIWAAWITGATRARVMAAALGAPKTGRQVLAIATDGILTTGPLGGSGITVTPYDLGTWDESDHQDAWLGMPGIYGFGADDADDKKYKRRGLDRRYFPISHLRAYWQRGEWLVPPLDPDTGQTCAGVRGFMPFRLAVNRTASLDVLGEWPEFPKTVKFTSLRHKRCLPDDVDPFLPHDGSSIWLGPIVLPDDAISEPYDIVNYEERAHTGDLDVPVWEQADLDELDQNRMMPL